ncbi:MULTISPECIES: Mor transcription activator family protein [Ligilactobacillus]|jgi:Mor family transcriptional regulator|uniref:Mor transcription activator domain-containing protein n=2 Tax=Ligilactobacillus murinus TaxID=1622 RepID=A0A2Z4VZH2_9LACO|nr:MULTISPECIES: Mor transcription activator family protein [Ligilactobacillus]MDE7023638.1 hypothetical protein [Ligilactobacillus sp.]NBH86190.1 hypothetical protein [Lachnospiraceae bacterium]GFI64247.1 hypothetical protein IMSAG117_01664 [Lactobacillaceae bacterium]HAB49948.1 hypothetical protein [Lactobacillus sp.]AWZ38711.1 hypothetical protein CPS94_07210 [Ligilactobacillus murinus]
MTDEVDKELLNEFYQELADLIGLENAYKLHETYRGLSYTFPMRLYDPKKVAQKIVAEYNGENASELARRYGYSMRWVLEVLRKEREKRHKD